jgi:hypothetical protein
MTLRISQRGLKSSGAFAGARAAAVPLLVFLAHALLLTGCQSSPTAQQASRPASTSKQKKQERAVEVHVFEDEAMLKGSQALIGGTVRNISGKRLENLSVELELRRRDGSGTETRELSVTPQTLEPGAEGRYALNVPTRDWSSSHLLSLRCGSPPGELAFKSEVGARRPPERLPEGRERIVIVPRPKPRQGDDYLNTPETADPIR